MSDTPSPTPDALKPKLNLAPKATSPAEASAAPANSGLEYNPAHPNQASSNVTPPGLAASIAASGAAGAAPRPAFKLQGNVHPANPDKFSEQKFISPIPADSDAPSAAIVALSAVAAVAAITFAALLFLKTQ